MSVSRLAELKRIGPLISEEQNTRGAVHDLLTLAENVGQTEMQVTAPSASHAAAWLLCVQDASAWGKVGERPDIQQPYFDVAGESGLGPNVLIAFRGQAAKYESIVSTLGRLKKSERIEWDRAFMWFHAAVSAWYNTHFRYLNGKRDNGGIDSEAALGLAQHYQLPIFVLDWTWNPMIAMAFALAGVSPGQEAVVCVRYCGDGSRPTESHNVLLPPTFARRPWRQRGLFSWQPVTPELWSDPTVLLLEGGLTRLAAKPDSYWRIKFPASAPDIGWAKYTRRRLMHDEEPKLGGLATWARTAAQQAKGEPPHARVLDVESFKERCRSKNVQLPSLLTQPESTTYTENPGLVLDYLDEMSIRRSPVDGKPKYFIPNLSTACAGMPFLSWFASKQDPERLQTMDERAAVFFGEDGSPKHMHWDQQHGYLNSIGQSRPELIPGLIESLLVERRGTKHDTALPHLGQR